MTGPSGPLTPPPSVQPAPPLAASTRAGLAPGVVVLLALGVLLAAAGLFVLLRAPSTSTAAPAPPPAAPAPSPEQTGLAVPEVPASPADPSSGLPTDPVETLWLVMSGDPRFEGRYTRAQVEQMARWACRRIAAWSGSDPQQRLDLWARMVARYDLPDETIAAIFTGVLEPVCSDGRGDAV